MSEYQSQFSMDSTTENFKNSLNSTTERESFSRLYDETFDKRGVDIEQNKCQPDEKAMKEDIEAGTKAFNEGKVPAASAIDATFGNPGSPLQRAIEDKMIDRYVACMKKNIGGETIELYNKSKK